MQHILRVFIRCAALLFIVLTLSGVGFSASAEVRGKGHSLLTAREYLLKAAFIYNFATYATWPKGVLGAPSDPIRICILGSHPFNSEHDPFAGLQIRGRPIEFVSLATQQAAIGCHVLFVSPTESSRLLEVIAALRNQPVLTIADSPNFLEAGGMINLRTVNNRLRFDINRQATEHAGLKLSAQLLKLADAVKVEGTPIAGR